MPEASPVDILTNDRSGDIIAGKYRLEHVLGQGGMGTVWRAQNLALDSPVAIKVLSAAVDASALRERLLIEARAAAKLVHPAIVKVYDVDETESGEPFIVMELLNGTSLGTLLAEEGRLPSARVVQLLLPIADALRLAHDKGLVHRDVKPDNVFIVEDEGSIQPKLVDFGIVKVARERDRDSLTRAGDVMGSPDYMSPEQARGDAEITFASDIWALSVVLYEAIAGRPPFSGRNYNALLWQILEATPPTLSELCVADEALSAIVARGLSKQPAARFASMRDFGRCLADWLLKQGLTEDVCGTAIESKWLSKGVARDDTGGPWRGVAWPPEASSGLRLKFAPRPSSSLAQTVPGELSPSIRQRRSTGKWLTALVAMAVTAAVARAAVLQQRSDVHPVSAVPRPTSTDDARKLTPAPAATSGGAVVVEPETLALEGDDSEAGRPKARDDAPLRFPPARKPPGRPAAPSKASKSKKDLLNPY